mmetsp:Transcript_25968/g.54908  ORF Transcript_25968/g.54908 Transcript_25968/m.54908 type:complete len:245 (+) Transcript_25968:631-1365(+)
MRAVQSLEAVATLRMPGEKEADRTSSPCPANSCKHSPVSAHQMRATRSSEAPTKRRPSAENEHASTACTIVRKSAPVSAHQRRPTPLVETVTNVEPPGANVAAINGSPTSITRSTLLLRWRRCALPSMDAVRQRRGARTRRMVSPQSIPASRSVSRSSSTRLRKSKRNHATFVPPSCQSVLAQSCAAVSPGRARRAPVRTSPLMALRTTRKSSLGCAVGALPPVPTSGAKSMPSAIAFSSACCC